MQQNRTSGKLPDWKYGSMSVTASSMSAFVGVLSCPCCRVCTQCGRQSGAGTPVCRQFNQQHGYGSLSTALGHPAQPFVWAPAEKGLRDFRMDSLDMWRCTASCFTLTPRVSSASAMARTASGMVPLPSACRCRYNWIPACKGRQMQLQVARWRRCSARTFCSFSALAMVTQLW